MIDTPAIRVATARWPSMSRGTGRAKAGRSSEGSARGRARHVGDTYEPCFEKVSTRSPDAGERGVRPDRDDLAEVAVAGPARVAVLQPLQVRHLADEVGEAGALGAGGDDRVLARISASPAWSRSGETSSSASLAWLGATNCRKRLRMAERSPLAAVWWARFCDAPFYPDPGAARIMPPGPTQRRGEIDGRKLTAVLLAAALTALTVTGASATSSAPSRRARRAEPIDARSAHRRVVGRPQVRRAGPQPLRPAAARTVPRRRRPGSGSRRRRCAVSQPPRQLDDRGQLDRGQLRLERQPGRLEDRDRRARPCGPRA